MADDAAPLLLDAGQETGNIDQGDHRNVERIAGADETGALVRRVEIQRPSLHRRLVGDQTDHHPFDATKSDDQIGREIGVHFEEFVGIEQALDDPVHVHRFGRILGNQLIHRLVFGQGELGRNPCFLPTFRVRCRVLR